MPLICFLSSTSPSSPNLHPPHPSSETPIKRKHNYQQTPTTTQFLSHHNAPGILREGVGKLAQLDARELVVHALRDGTGGLAGVLGVERDVDHLALVQNAVDGAANGRRAGGEALQQAVLRGGLLNLVDGEDTLADLELVPLARQLPESTCA